VGVVLPQQTSPLEGQFQSQIRKPTSLIGKPVTPSETLAARHSANPKRSMNIQHLLLKYIETQQLKTKKQHLANATCRDE